MDVRFYKYNSKDYSLTALGTVDNYSSFMFTRSFVGIGNWKMVISGTTANAQRIKNADMISVTDGVAGLITDFSEEVNEKGITYTFSGAFIVVNLFALLASRRMFDHYLLIEIFIASLIST